MRSSFSKKNSESPNGISGRNLSMKILPWIVCCMLVSLHSFGFPQNQKMNVQFENATLEEVVANLESLTNHTFVYSDLDKNGISITANAEEDNLESLLTKIFGQSPLTFEIRKDNVIVLRKMEQIPNRNQNTPQQPK